MTCGTPVCLSVRRTPVLAPRSARAAALTRSCILMFLLSYVAPPLVGGGRGALPCGPQKHNGGTLMSRLSRPTLYLTCHPERALFARSGPMHFPRTHPCQSLSHAPPHSASSMLPAERFSLVASC